MNGMMPYPRPPYDCCASDCCRENRCWPPPPEKWGGCFGDRGDAPMKIRLFGHNDKGCCGQNPPAAQTVTLVNPWNCREKAVVSLSIDECGNLVVYVKR